MGANLPPGLAIVHDDGTNSTQEYAYLDASSPSCPVSQKLPLVVVITTLCICYLAICLHRGCMPAEDAAMIVRYALNLAHGHGLVYNVGCPPVDGATDFLFTLGVASFIACGASAPAAVLGLTCVSHIATVLVVFEGALLCCGQRRARHLTASACALFVLTGPGFWYAAAWFGAPFFALWAALSWYLVLRSVTNKTTELALPLGVVFTLMVLTRPEGLFLVGFMMAATSARMGHKFSRNLFLPGLALLLMAGGIYFAWHWWYFHWPLPNAYYKKGGDLFYGSALGASVGNSLLFLVPAATLYITLGGRTPNRANLVLVFLPIIGWAAIWILISGEMNYLARFQYPVLAISLMSLPALLGGEYQDESSVWGTGLQVMAATTGILLWAAFWHSAATRERYDQQPILAGVGHWMHTFSCDHPRLATTEAGLLPLYSGWQTLDTWGLNDAWIAHHGKITDGYLRAYRPELLVMHMRGTSFCSRDHGQLVLGHSGRGWNDMLAVLQGYAQRHGYILAAALGRKPTDVTCFYVRPHTLLTSRLCQGLSDWSRAGHSPGVQNFAAGLNISPGKVTTVDNWQQTTGTSPQNTAF